jgi:hypothetical protein
MSRTVEVTITPDSAITIEVDGAEGTSCDMSTGAILKALEAEVISDDKKPEYYSQESVADMY